MTEPKHLSDSDVFTLMGHAHYLRALGQADMPKWCYELAERIAMTLGDKYLAERVAAVAAKELTSAPNGDKEAEQT